MDDLERKLRQYNEHKETDQLEIREDFLAQLKSLEAARIAAPRPHRRFVLPAAALITLVLLLGSGLIYLHSRQPDKSPALDSNGAQVKADVQTLTEPADPAPDKPAPAGSVPPAPETPEQASPEKQDDPASAKPEAELPVNAETPTPVQPDHAAPAGSDGGTAAEPDAPTPAKPDDPSPAKPDDATPSDPQDTTPATTDGPNPPVPVQPEEQTPPLPDEPEHPDPPVETPPAEDPPVPSEPPEISIVYLISDGRETFTLTNLSTGESVDVDVTGIVPFCPQTPPEPDFYWDEPLFPAANYEGSCSAFGWEISYRYSRASDNTLEVKVTDLRPDSQAEKGEQP